MTDLLELLVLQSVWSWLLLLSSAIILSMMPRLFGLPTLSAIVYGQLSLFLNIIPIVAGLDIGLISPSRALHFFVIAIRFLSFVFLTYRRLLFHRKELYLALQTFAVGVGSRILIVLMLANSIFQFFIVPADGSSRIEYMTEGWYTVLRPVLQLATPLSYFAALILWLTPRYAQRSLVLLMLTLSANILSGSKASFVFSLIIAYFAIRDLNSINTQLFSSRLWKLLLIIPLFTVAALERLGVTIGDIMDRFLLFGEATILIYFSDHPTEACSNVTEFAKMHRGLARLLGDSSSRDIDTLFGFALNKLALGDNSFTGPNARISPYFLCNFDQTDWMLGALMIIVYLLAMLLLVRRSLPRPILLAFAFPFAIMSISNAAQDYNQMMSDLSICCIFILLTLVSRAKRHSDGYV